MVFLCFSTYRNRWNRTSILDSTGSKKVNQLLRNSADFFRCTWLDRMAVNPGRLWIYYINLYKYIKYYISNYKYTDYTSFYMIIHDYTWLYSVFIHLGSVSHGKSSTHWTIFWLISPLYHQEPSTEFDQTWVSFQRCTSHLNFWRLDHVEQFDSDVFPA
jgi:hypothetical protein